MIPITLAFKDHILKALVVEQLANSLGITIQTDVQTGGLLITDDAANDWQGVKLILGGKTDEGLALPLRLGQFSDRVRYLLSGRERFAGPLEPFVLGALVFDAASQTVKNETTGTVVKLTDQEKLIVLALYAAPQYRLTRRELLQAAWGYAETTETHTLETHIYRLRQKLEDGLGVTDFIVTDEGVYRLKV